MDGVTTQPIIIMRHRFRTAIIILVLFVLLVISLMCFYLY